MKYSTNYSNKFEIPNLLILARKRMSVYYTLELSTLHNELIPQKYSGDVIYSVVLVAKNSN